MLCLILPTEGKRLAPVTLGFCAVELLLILALVVGLGFGSSAEQKAASLLLGGVFGVGFWALAILLGILVPAGLEALELRERGLPGIPTAVPPVLKLAGGVALRFVVVYAGLASVLPM